MGAALSRSTAAQVGAYIRSLPPVSRRRLRQIRAAIRSAAPRAVEGISYGILGFKLDGRPLVACAGWKSHASVYPLSATMRRAIGPTLKAYKTSKGTIQFPIEKPVPAGLVRRIVKARMGELRKKAGT